MKKIFCAVIVAVGLVACGEAGVVTCGETGVVTPGNKPMYFDTSDNRTYDVANAEFDTLSYAVGMNLGLGLRFQPSGLTFNYEALMNALNEELAKEVFDYDAADANKELVERFFIERLQPYAVANMAKRNNSSPIENGPSKQLFNEEFTKDGVSEMFGRDMANYICRAAYPINLHWLRTAIDDAANAEGNEVHDSLMRLTVMQMRNSLQTYHMRIHPEYIVQASRNWLKMVAQQPDVETMVIDEFDTLYFRINNAGNDVKPRGLNDTIAFSYDLYTRSGKLVESQSKRANDIREALEKEKADTVQDERRLARIQMLTDQLESVENLRVPVSKALLKGLQYGIQNIGEGGDITLWIPAPLAFGERGNRIVHGHDAVVMNVHLKSVSYGPTDEELAAMEEEKRAKGIQLPNGVFTPKPRPDGSMPQMPVIPQKNVVKPVELK